MSAPVTIIIAFHNGNQWLSDLVKSLSVTTHPHTVILADDCSPEPPSAIPDSWVHMRHPENLGYVANVNKALESVPAGNHAFILNQDTKLVADPVHWLTNLADSLEWRRDRDNAAAVGPLVTYGPGFQVLRGVLAPSECEPGDFNYWAPWLSGGCYLVHADVLARGEPLLEPALNNMGHDDINFAFRCRARGETLWICQQTLFWHDAREDDRGAGAGDKNPDGEAWMARRWGADWKKRMSWWDVLDQARMPKVTDEGEGSQSPYKGEWVKRLIHLCDLYFGKAVYKFDEENLDPGKEIRRMLLEVPSDD